MQWLCNFTSNFNVIWWIKHYGIFTVSISMCRSLNSEDKSCLMFIKQDCPSSTYFWLTNFKLAGIITKSLCSFWDNFGINPTQEIFTFINFIFRSINEYIFLSWMSMKVYKHLGFKLFCNRTDYFYFFKIFLFIEYSIQIPSWNTRAKVSKNNTININHGNDFEFNFLPQIMGLWRTKIPYKSFDHPASLSLTRM